MKKPTPPNRVIFTTASATVEEQVRGRAYELFEARGREEGHDFEDWLRAEEEVTGRKTRVTAA